MTPEQRIMKYVAKQDNGCWLWIGCVIADQLDGISRSARDATSFADIMNALPYFLNRYGGGNER